MIPERSQLYFERILYHRRFFIPASICLFLAFPGTVAALLPSNTIPLYPAQRIETLLLFLPVVFSYTALLIWDFPRPQKILFSFLLLLVPLFLTSLLLRNTVFSENFHHALFRPEVIGHFIPGYLMFLALCAMDKKKRAPSIFWTLIGLMVPLSILSGVNKDAVRFLDELRHVDIADRMAHREPINNSMLEQCALISDLGLRQKCRSSIHAAMGTDLKCAETENFNDCSLSRREHVERALSGHPSPEQAPTK